MALTQPVVDHSGRNLASASLFAKVVTPAPPKVTSPIIGGSVAAVSNWQTPREINRREGHLCKLDPPSQRLLHSRLGLPLGTPVSKDACLCTSRWKGSDVDAMLHNLIPTHVGVLVFDINSTLARVFGKDRKEVPTTPNMQKISFHLSTTVDECVIPIGTPKILEVTPTGGTLTVELLDEKNLPYAVGAVIISNELPPPHVLASQGDTQHISIELRACSGKSVGSVTLKLSFLCLESQTPHARILDTEAVYTTTLQSPVFTRTAFGEKVEDSEGASSTVVQLYATTPSPASWGMDEVTDDGPVLRKATLWSNLADEKQAPRLAGKDPIIIPSTRKGGVANIRVRSASPALPVTTPQVQVTSRSLTLSDDEEEDQGLTKVCVKSRGAMSKAAKKESSSPVGSSPSIVDMLATGTASSPADSTDSTSVSRPGKGMMTCLLSPFSASPTSVTSASPNKKPPHRLFEGLFQGDKATFETQSGDSALEASPDEADLSRVLHAGGGPTMMPTHAALEQAKKAGLIASNRRDVLGFTVGTFDGASLEYEKAMAQGLLCSAYDEDHQTSKK